MLKRIKEIIELIKLLYIKISIACCCKSECQVGTNAPPPSPINAANSPSNDDNNNNHTTTSII